MNEHKAWQPKMRDEPIFNPFESSTDWTRDIGANERVEVPDEEDETASADRNTATKGTKPASN